MNSIKSIRLLTSILMVFLLLCSLTVSSISAQSEDDGQFISDELGSLDKLTLEQEEISEAKSALGDTVIGIVAATMEAEWHYQAVTAAKERAEELGIKAQIFDSQQSADRAITGIESFVSRGVKAIIVDLADVVPVLPAIEEAMNSGVKVVQLAGRQVGEFGAVTVSVEDADLGAAAGAFAAKLINTEFKGDATVAILDYPDLPNVVIRANNIEKMIKQNAPNATIVGRYLGGTIQNGLKSMESALQAHPNINVVVSINDDGAIGAVQALRSVGKTAENTIVVGIDAIQQAVEMIANGTMYRGTVDTQPAKTGKLTFNALLKWLAGSKMYQNYKVPLQVIDRQDAKALLGE